MRSRPDAENSRFYKTSLWTGKRCDAGLRAQIFTQVMPTSKPDADGADVTRIVEESGINAQLKL
jgi:hypothetical protein